MAIYTRHQKYFASAVNTTPKRPSTAALPLFALALALTLPRTATATVFEVSPEGSPYSIAGALAEAGPGDTVYLADGVYDEPIVTMAGGQEGSPLVIEGGHGAVINGASGDMYQAIFVQHSWITLQGFTVDGHVGEEEVRDSFIDKCVYVEGSGAPTNQQYQGRGVTSSLIGFVMDGLSIKNCGGECVRLKSFVTNALLTNNVIEHCGVYDFRFDDDGGKNGEAIYVGTSSTQWTDGPDGSNYNVISHNTMTPHGNECIDVKEGATGNVIEDNECAEQLDANSGCYGSRGSGNIFRNNHGSHCVGAGIRLGGWTVDGVTYGLDNEVYDNDFDTTGRGVISAQETPQGLVCGNTCDEGTGLCDVYGVEDLDAIATEWNQPCPEPLPEVPFVGDSVTTSSAEKSDDDNAVTTTSTQEEPTESTQNEYESDDDAGTPSTSSTPEEYAPVEGDDDGDDTTATASPSSQQEFTSTTLTEEEQESEDDDSGVSSTSAPTTPATQASTTAEGDDDEPDEMTPSSSQESTATAEEYEGEIEDDDSTELSTEDLSTTTAEEEQQGDDSGDDDDSEEEETTPSSSQESMATAEEYEEEVEDDDNTTSSTENLSTTTGEEEQQEEDDSGDDIDSGDDVDDDDRGKGRNNRGD